MCLKVALKTENGLDLAEAVLVITSLSDNNNSQYHYSVPPIPSGAGEGFKYQPTEQSAPYRQGNFQVSIFANEDVLKEGKPAIGYLHTTEQQPTFHFKFKSAKPGGQLAEAYKYLKELYPKAEEFDLSDIGLN